MNVTSNFGHFSAIRDVLRVKYNGSRNVARFYIVRFFIIARYFRFLSVFLLRRDGAFFSAPFPGIKGDSSFGTWLVNANRGDEGREVTNAI